MMKTEGSGAGAGSIPLTNGSDPGGPKTCGSGFGSGTLPVGRHAVRVDEGLEGARELVGAEESGRGLRVRHLVQYRGCTVGITFGQVPY
jgi:hypothetical protein